MAGFEDSHELVSVAQERCVACRAKNSQEKRLAMGCPGVTRVPLPNLPLLEPKHGRAPDDSWMRETILIKPVYFEGYRNVCEIVLEDGRFYWGHSPAKTAVDLNRCFGNDVAEKARQYKMHTSRAQGTPIIDPLRGHVFIPLKARIPRYRNDGAFGYVRSDYIAHIAAVHTKCAYQEAMVMLKTGESLYVMTSPENVRAQGRLAQYFLDRLRDEHKSN